MGVSNKQRHMKNQELFIAWLYLGGLYMTFGHFYALYQSGGDEAVRAAVAYNQFDPCI